VLEPPCISVDSLQGHTLAFDKDITLISVEYHSQGITLPPIVGTPTPNGLRSSWDFLLGRSPNMFVVLAPSTFIPLEGGLDDKLSPQSVF